jgi:amino acid adenylation domain-containing protein/non-ribosomal peptide synthase protein (TIGR01720 family)
MARRERVTVSTMFLATWAILLSRYSEKDEVIFGSTVSGRSAPLAGIESMVGLFINAIPVRVRLNADSRLTDWLREMQEQQSEARQYEFSPLLQVQAWSEIGRGQPMFESLAAYENYPVDHSMRSQEGSRMKVVDFRASERTNYPITVIGIPGPQVVLQIWYDATLFGGAAISRVLGHFQSVLEGMLARPEGRLSELSLLTDEERSQVVAQWNETRRDYEREGGVRERFERTVEAYRDSIAVVDGFEQLSYGGLEERASAIAAWLKGTGLKEEQCVGIYRERSLRYVEEMVGVLKAGGAYVPLDPSYPAERVRYMVEDCGIRVVLGEETRKEIEKEGRKGVQVEERARGGRGGERLCYVMYTSGSTGQPKGVEVVDRGVMRLVLGVDYVELKRRRRVLHMASPSFDASTFEVWSALLHGGVLVVLGERVPSLERLRETVRRERVDTMWLTASLFNAVMDESAESLDGVEQLLIGGEALSVPHVVRARQRWPEQRLVNGYGPTEGTTFTCCYGIGEEIGEESRTVPIGRPIGNTRVYVLDGSMEPVGVGVAGELYVGGEGLARGYRGLPELSAKAFVPDPVGGEAGGRLYRTGDRVRYRTDGNVEFLGRVDHQVKLRGFRVELGEVESVLREHPAVSQAVVRVRESGAQKGLLGYAVLDGSWSGYLQEAEHEWLSHWRVLYEETYGKEGYVEDATFNIVGWNSSYTGEPFSADEMREQVEQTVSRVLSKKPRRVLEIGCGTGLLLFRIAPECEYYEGTDFSERVLEYVEAQRGEQGGMEGVRLRRGEADDFEGVERESFDVVILNSVVQYFPSLEYLGRVLSKSLESVVEGGYVYVGDVRNLSLLPAYHASVQVHQASPTLSRAELYRRYQQRLGQETELVLGPSYFESLRERMSGVGEVEVHLRRGRHHNELTAYRYDVWIRKGKARREAEVEWLDWEEAGLSLTEVERRLREERPSWLCLFNVGNARVEPSLGAWRSLTSSGDESATAGELRESLKGRRVTGVDPEEFWKLGEETGYEVTVEWGMSGEKEGRYEVLCRREEGKREEERAGRRREAGGSGIRSEYATNPLRGLMSERLIPELRTYLEERLPEYMVPSWLVILERLPLSLNGKLDVEGLPVPEGSRPELGVDYVGPRNEVEEELSRIWAQVLDVDRVGVYDNFFELGGDSILSIQAVSRANQAGLRLTPRQIFQHQTIAELSTVVGRSRVEAPQGAVTGEVELTPIQRWYFEQERVKPQHFNQTLLLKLGQRLDGVLLSGVIEHLVMHHDALRLKYRREGERWVQSHSEAGRWRGSDLFTYEDLSSVPVTKRGAELTERARRQQGSLSLTEGPLVKVTLFEMGDGSQRLLCVIHHLVVDGVSWRILLEDLLRGYQQLSGGETVHLGQKTSSFQSYAQRLKEYSASEELSGEESYWRGVEEAEWGKLPRDYEGGTSEVGGAETVAVSLGVEETRALLKEVPSAYRSEVSDVLLTALVEALSPSLSGSRAVRFDLEGHGREELWEDMDLTRTVGWFTTLYPVRLEVEEGSGPGESLQSVKEQLRRIPNKGMGYGVLRYLGGKRWGGGPSEVSFNYLGQVDAALPEGMPVELAPESSGEAEDASERRTQLLSINAAVSGGALSMMWTFSPKVHRRERVEGWAEAYLKSLRSLIAHCVSQKTSGWSARDFPLVKLSARELSRLAEQKGVEDIYPLSPMQAGLLFHCLYAPESGVYFEQHSCLLEGGFDTGAFRRAWQKAVERHTILRTAFEWKGLEEPVQIVHREVAVPWREYDWRALSKEVQRKGWEDFLKEDREEGFDLGRAPLMRLALVRVGEQSYRLVWSHHHLILDGWSLPLLFREVMLLYEGYVRGRELPLEPSGPYRNFIAWLKEQDLEAAERFWRDNLKGFTSPTPLGMDWVAPAEAAREGLVRRQHVRLSPATTAALERFARGKRLTANTVVQGAWALLLSRYSGREDVLFGATVSGRSAPLPGIETAVGLFINAIPVRVHVRPDAIVSEWLEELQQQQAQALHYSYAPLFELQKWSEVPTGLPMFESLMAFENFPVNRSMPKQRSTVRVRDLQLNDSTNYPLTILVIPGPEITIRMDYETRRFAQENISRLLDRLQAALEGFVNQPESPLFDIDPGAVTELPRMGEVKESVAPPSDAEWKMLNE